MAATGVGLWWMNHVPDRRTDLYKAVPLQADFLVSHRGLAARWDEVFANPLVSGLFARANLKSSELRELREGPQFRDWLGRLADEEILFAHVPRLSDGEDGWIFASWLGGRSQRLRLGLMCSSIPGIEYAGTRRGWPVWTVRSKLFKGGETLSFSLVEGMLVGSYAGSARAIDTVLNCVDGRYPSLGRVLPSVRPSAEFRDAGWCRLGADSSLTQARRMHFAIDTLASNRMAGVLRFPGTWLKGQGPLVATPPELPARVLGDLPQAVLIAPPGPAASLLLDHLPGLFTVVAADLIEGQTVGPLYAALTAGDYGGELFGMKWPSLLVAASTTNADALADRIDRRLDHLNTLKPWHLRRDHCDASGHPLHYISSASNTLYADARRDDRVALGAGEGWMLASSNLAGLTNLLRDAALRANRPVRLSEQVLEARQVGAVAWFWCSLPDAGKSLRMGLGAWSLHAGAIGGREARKTRALFSEIRRWMVCAEPLGELRLWALPGEDGTEIHFSTFPAAGKP